MCEPCHVARRDREREQYAARRIAGLCGRCGTPAPSDAAYCDRCARSAAKRSRKKAKNARSRQRYVQAASTKALYRLCRTVPGRVPVSPVRPPVLGAFGRASRSAGSAASSYGHRDRLGEVNHGTWDRWEDVVVCLAFAKLSRDQVELIPDM